MELRIKIPSGTDVKLFFGNTQGFIIKAGWVSLAYFVVAYLGKMVLPYMAIEQIFELPAIALAAAFAIKYKWTGVVGAAFGSFLFHLLQLPVHLALYLGVTLGASAFLFAYLFMLLIHSEVIDQVSSVAAFAFIAAPVACFAHSLFFTIILQANGHMLLDALGQNILSCWFNELLIAVLLVPLLLSLFDYKKMYFSTKEKIEVLAIFVGMEIVAWLVTRYGKSLGLSEIVIFVLLTFVLWAALRFKSVIAHAATFLAAIIAFSTIIFSGNHGNTLEFSQAIFTLKVGLLPLALGGLFVAGAFSERHVAEAKLNQLVNHDPLTGLPNRAYFHDFIDHSLAHAQRQQHEVYLLFIDLDRFKKINDSQGHDIGDAVLKIIAKRLNDVLRGDDFVARLGGDEFAVVFTHPPVKNAASNLARKLIKVVSEPFDLHDRRYSVGASIGISVYPNDTFEANTLLRQADLAMYQAKSKQSGFEYFSESMNALAQEQLQIENGLKQALENKELLLMYQPKMDLATGEVVGLEALVRWLQNDELIGPDKFIPIAEEAGLIIPVGLYVIRAACEQWVAWNEAGLNPPAVAVNISPRQFSDPNLLNDIRTIIAATGMNPAMLNVEITESATMEDPEMTMQVLEAMRELKLHLYIDDFGTGHSNLGQLRRLPIDALKIDKSFIHDIMNNDDDAEIVMAIINLAHALKLRVVAEGIETKSQLELLRGLGCDEIQGFLISKPAMPAQVQTFFNRKISV